jgi:hypothetical protein
MPMLTIHLTLTIDANTDEQSATDLGEHFKNIIWKEAYENLQMPATTATAYAEHS